METGEKLTDSGGSRVRTDQPKMLAAHTHASIQMAIDTYSYVAPGIQEAAAKRFDELIHCFLRAIESRISPYKASYCKLDYSVRLETGESLLIRIEQGRGLDK